MQARELLNYPLKYCWLKVICCICQSNELNARLSTQLARPSCGPDESLVGTWPTQATS